VPYFADHIRRKWLITDFVLEHGITQKDALDQAQTIHICRPMVQHTTLYIVSQERDLTIYVTKFQEAVYVKESA
jgi:hypothetical protein